MKAMPDQLSLALSSEVSLDVLLVHPGHFIMGDEYTGPEHLVQITQPFYIGKYPITQAQWQAVMQDNHESSFPGNQRPVENVSWNEIVEDEKEDSSFLTRLNAILSTEYPDVFATHKFTLPTEAQWEYAAKGGPQYSRIELEGKQAAQLYTAYAGSDRMESCGWFDGNNDVETRPVGLKAPNELGVYDMSGNVWEWCFDKMDWYEYEKRKEPVTLDPINTVNGDSRVVRGGSSWNHAWGCRVAYRGYDPPANRYVYFGFRVVLSPSSGSGTAG